MQLIDTSTLLELNGKKRKDLLIRCLAAEEFNKKNNIGIKLYNKMMIEIIKHPFHCKKRFQNLFINIQKDNKIKKPIQISINNNIIRDGYHRASIAFALNIPQIYIAFITKEGKVNKCWNWVQENFTEEEYYILKQETKRPELWMLLIKQFLKPQRRCVSFCFQITFTILLLHKI